MAGLAEIPDTLEGLLEMFAHLPYERVLATYLQCDGNGDAACEKLLSEPSDLLGAGPPTPHESLLTDFKPNHSCNLLDCGPGDDFSSLSSLYPQVDPEFLMEMWLSVGGDFERASELLHSQLHPEAPSPAATLPSDATVSENWWAPAGAAEEAAPPPASSISPSIGPSASLRQPLAPLAVPLPVALDAQFSCGSPAEPSVSTPTRSRTQSAQSMVMLMDEEGMNNSGGSFVENAGFRSCRAGTKRAATSSNDGFGRAWHQQRQAEFKANRERVRALVEERDQLKQAAIDASRRNDTLGARKLRDQADQLHRDIQRLEQSISQSTAVAVNQGHAGSDGRHELPPIDLHCQTVAGALCKLRSDWPMLACMKRVWGPCALRIITGRGVHSQNAVCKIREAVQQWLWEVGVEHQWAEDGGSVAVLL